MTSKQLLALSIIILLGGILRFMNLTNNPEGLGTDEVTFGYSAYSILKTGKDEHGAFLPMSFRSVGDFKSPVGIYATVPFIALLGLNEYGVRVPFALIGTLAIPILYLFALTVSENQGIALASALMLAISPWHIFYSRIVHDHPLAMVFVVIGCTLFFKFLKNKTIFAGGLSALFLVVSMYTYHTEKIFVPLLLLLLSWIHFRDNDSKFTSRLLKFWVMVIALAAPLIVRAFSGSDILRGQMVFVAKDVEFRRYVFMDGLSPNFLIGGLNLDQMIALFFFILSRYLNYFKSSFLFFTGLDMTRSGSLGLGVMNMFEIPLLFLGVWKLIRDNSRLTYFSFGWIILSFLPASLSNNDLSTSRTIVVLPVLVIISALGMREFVSVVQKLKPRIFKIGVTLTYLGVVCVSLAQAYLTFAVHLALDRGESTFQGTKEAVLYALENQTKYQQLVFDPIRGVDAPRIYSLPEYYVLFYSKYDPNNYQEWLANRTEADTGFDNFSFRNINWREDRYKVGTLFIGSPWSLPEKEMKDGEILKRIYLANGDLALLVVSPLPSKK